MSFILSGGDVARSLAGPVERVDLIVDQGRIASETSSATDRLDVSGCIVLPGNVCAHHHLYSVLARGMPGPRETPRNFIEILERIWWRLDRALDLETIELSALAGAVEAARSGTTAIVDHHASPEAVDSSLDAVASGVERAGLRGVVSYEVTDRHGEEGGRAGIAENARFRRANRRPLIRSMMGAHASFTIGNDTMATMVASARDLGMPLHVHVAEDSADQEDSLTRHGMRVIDRLSKHGALARGDLIAHGVHLDPAELEALRSSGAWLAHNPRSNMNNGVGYAPVVAAGERVALGTDGIDGDMLAETRAAYLKAREIDVAGDFGWAVARLAEGARLVGTIFDEPQLGRLERGSPADLVVYEYAAPTPVTADNLHGHLLFGAGTLRVRHVAVEGRLIVRDGVHQLIDEEELAARCRDAARRLWARMDDL